MDEAILELIRGLRDRISRMENEFAGYMEAHDKLHDMLALPSSFPSIDTNLGRLATRIEPHSEQYNKLAANDHEWHDSLWERLDTVENDARKQVKTNKILHKKIKNEIKKLSDELKQLKSRIEALEDKRPA